ncbi:Matrixin [Posidoniimonas corsicana]|uniref:Matrixin n=1 Tax=Posidoniimonas corsicana TaxID=1938618 RepID=A0A5C5VGZ3_9BACT|nr:matrixin family metalloprotease [Posidoniimonas corsicana]TWT36985.1 Matrixin [Posidoniimonas corsicana]
MPPPSYLPRLLIAAAAALQATHGWAYVPDERWSFAASGPAGVEGDPVTLTWSFVDDGASISDGESSNLISYLDDQFNVQSPTDDLTDRPWFTLFERSFDRWSELGGVTFQYEAHDDGQQLGSGSGALGVRGDIRIGGKHVDGPNGTLAYTWLPNNGDMVIDTGETAFYSNPSNDYRQFRNTVMHEVGHALGLLHVESDDSRLLLEPYITTTFDGPQLDDIRGLHALYGDAYEKTYNGQGNGAYTRATPLGKLVPGGELAVGSDAAGNQSVDPLETDFVSIANNSDRDFFSFTVDAPATLDATLTPLGGVFNQAAQGGVQSTFDANARNDLRLAIFAPNGMTPIAVVDAADAGGVESLSGFALDSPGQYYARVMGGDDNVQFYELRLSAAAPLLVLAGDYNGDGVVDAADYTVWRDSLGQSGQSLAADGNGDLLVDSADYGLWRSNFGESAATVGLAENAPEPAAVLLLASGGLACLRRRR